jgi:hypothetical protein
MSWWRCWPCSRRRRTGAASVAWCRSSLTRTPPFGARRPRRSGAPPADAAAAGRGAGPGGCRRRWCGRWAGSAPSRAVPCSPSWMTPRRPFARPPPRRSAAATTWPPRTPSPPRWRSGRTTPPPASLAPARPRPPRPRGGPFPDAGRGAGGRRPGGSAVGHRRPRGVAVAGRRPLPSAGRWRARPTTLAALRALGDLGLAEAAPALEPFLTAPDVDQRRAAARAAIPLAAELSEETVAALRRDEDDWVRVLAVRILGRRGPDDRSRLEPMANEDASPLVRAEARRVLGRKE